MSELKLARQRSSNYSAPEIECLLNHLEANVALAAGYKTGSEFSTPADFQLAWDALAEQITIAGGIYGSRRTGGDVKKKWCDLKCRVKGKANKLALELETSGGYASTKLTAVEERVLALVNQFEEPIEKKCDKLMQQDQLAIVKVFSYKNESLDDVSRHGTDHGDENNESSLSEADIMEELKCRSSEDKKRRISEAFANVGSNSSQKKSKISEEEQLHQLYSAQQEISNELHTIKDILRKCQVSIEKLAILKRAELQLKCAKYGVNFDDLFD